MTTHSSNFCEMHLRVLMLKYPVEDDAMPVGLITACMPRQIGSLTYHNCMGLFVFLAVRLKRLCAASLVINCNLDVAPADLSVVSPPGLDIQWQFVGHS